jgi:hypothetical protein
VDAPLHRGAACPELNRAAARIAAFNVQHVIEDRLYADYQGAVDALEAADRLADAVASWQSHVTLEQLTGEYRAARNAAGEQ